MKKLLKQLRKLYYDVRVLKIDKENFEKELEAACNAGAFIIYKKNNYYYLNEINNEDYGITKETTVDEIEEYLKNVEIRKNKWGV